MKNLLLVTVIALAVTACKTADKKPAAGSTATVYTLPDDKAITQAVREAYLAISFKKGEQPRFDEIQNYFIPEAQLINFRTDTADVSSIKRFVAAYKKYVADNKVQLFYEEEIYGKNEQFGKIAHRISTYKTYLNTMDTVSERGVNSFQLVKTPTGWKVSSIIWDVEQKDMPVPAYYLQK
ncbi:hypothetical protein A0256_24010 [Mucilaginibacter sp. PAMC 26640]|nr:hypothetical protein A0256_24010 [Mucilaginibacter sp. PAMC 26640]